MSQKLVVAVAGGTGKQGGAVVKSLLEQGHTWGTDLSRVKVSTAAGASCRIAFEAAHQIRVADEGLGERDEVGLSALDRPVGGRLVEPEIRDRNSVEMATRAKRLP